MKTLKILVLLICVAVFISFQQPRTLKVICIGDSITQGKVIGDSISELSYRFWIWEKIDSAGYNVDMLGSNSIWFKENRAHRVILPVSRYTGHVFDPDHEGFYGIKTGESLLGGFTHDSVKYESFHNRLLKYDAPDIAFIHIGSNDGKGDSLQTINYLKQIIEELNARNPAMKIFLAKLNTPWVRFVNHSIEPIVAEFKSKYPKMQIIAVDMASGWVNCPEAPNAMTIDWAHPNTLGQKTMAEKWYKAFLSLDEKEKPGFNPDIKLTNITDSSVTVSWNPATDNKFIAGYNVLVNNQLVNWRTSECGNKDRQCLALVSGNLFTVTGLKKGQEYELSVSAVDYANNVALSEKIKLVANSTSN